MRVDSLIYYMDNTEMKQTEEFTVPCLIIIRVCFFGECDGWWFKQSARFVVQNKRTFWQTFSSKLENFQTKFYYQHKI